MMAGTAAGRAWIIAEAGVNHNGDPQRAMAMVEAAAEAGADAVKFQTFRADALARAAAPKAAYQQRASGAGEGQLAMLRRLELPRAAHFALRARCRALGIAFLSTPFDRESLAFLCHELGVERLKLPSGEITNGPLLLDAARSGLPILLSTGMATLGEVEAALMVLAHGYLHPAADPPPGADPFNGDFAAAWRTPQGRALIAQRVTLLQCTTEYPADPASANLRAMAALGAAFGVAVGFSDHTPGIGVAMAAAALGARVIEKHFTLDRTLPGPDHAASLEPPELAALVREVRTVEAALGDGIKGPAAEELGNRAVVRKGLVAARAIAAGEPFSAGNMAVMRPEEGASPMTWWQRLGRPAPRDYAPGEPLP